MKADSVPPLAAPLECRRARSALPTEAEEQRAVLAWAAALRGRFPELALLYASPQGELYRQQHWRPSVAGLSPGIPDLHLPVARRGFHGLWIEMKRKKGGRLSDAQIWWGEQLRLQGHQVIVAAGAERAIAWLQRYLEIAP
jgi:hypothetical protein